MTSITWVTGSYVTAISCRFSGTLTHRETAVLRAKADAVGSQDAGSRPRAAPSAITEANQALHTAALRGVLEHWGRVWLSESSVQLKPLTRCRVRLRPRGGSTAPGVPGAPRGPRSPCRRVSTVPHGSPVPGRRAVMFPQPWPQQPLLIATPSRPHVRPVELALPSSGLTNALRLRSLLCPLAEGKRVGQGGGLPGHTAD